MTSKKLKVENWPVEKLIPYARNPRKNDQAVEQVAAAIKEFGFRVPIVAKSDGLLVDGHLRLKAAQRLGLKEVPVILADDMTDAQIKAFRISVNRMAELAEWDNELLALEFAELKELGFDTSLTGFDAEMISEIMPPEKSEPLTDEDAVPEVEETSVVKRGETWILGNHRLRCGDSTSAEDVAVLMNGEKADMVFTDPPYGIQIVSNAKVESDKPFGSRKGSVGGGGIIKANLYAPIAGDESIDVAVQAIEIIKTLKAKVEIIWGGNYYANSLENSSCWIVWDKQNTGNFADCELAWTNQKTSVRMFSHMWNGMIKASEHGQKRVHPTQKPVALAEWCLDQYGKDCLSVLDLFGGSGSTLLACENKKKSCYMMELSEHYCSVIIKRWQDYTGKDAILESTGETFNSIAAK